MSSSMTRSIHLALAIALALPSVAIAEPARLDDVVTFEPGRRRIYWKTRKELEALARTVRATCPAATLTVEGYAFIPHDEEASIELGQQRADLVRNLLVRYGVAPQSIAAVSRARSTLEEGNGRHVDIVIDCPHSR